MKHDVEGMDVDARRRYTITCKGVGREGEEKTCQHLIPHVPVGTHESPGLAERGRSVAGLGAGPGGRE